MNAELFKALTNGIAVFAFMKNNGELRPAVGTLNASVIAKFSPNTTVREVAIAENTNRYYDINSRGWRRISNNGAQATLIGCTENGTLILRVEE